MPIKLDLWDYKRFHKSIPHASNYPVISNVYMSPTGSVTWTTDVASTSQVLYGFVPYLGFFSPYDSEYETLHGINLSGLIPNSRYYFKVQSFRFDALSISHLYTAYVPPSGYSGFVLTSPDTQRWLITVTPNGNLESTLVSISNPILETAFQDIQMIFTDSDGFAWTLTIDDTGHLITTLGGDLGLALDSIGVYDTVPVSWIVTVTPEGNLETERSGVVSIPIIYASIILFDSSLVRWTVIPNLDGNLVTTATPVGPSGSLRVSPLILSSPSGLYYQVTVLTTGNLVTTLVGSAVTFYTSISVGSFALSVSDAGNLITT